VSVEVKRGKKTQEMDRLAEQYGVSRTTIHTRLKNGWDGRPPLPPAPRAVASRDFTTRLLRKENSATINRILANWRTT